MGQCRVAILICIAFLSADGQTPSNKYQPGTIIAVAIHQGAEHLKPNVDQYDVSVRVGNTSYVVLYAPPNGANAVKFSAGIELLVLVGSKTLTFNSAASGKMEVPILSHKVLPAESIDWSTICGQYFSLKLQHLSERLTLTDEQQAKLKPIVEQEAGEVNEICFNPVLSGDETLNRYDKILRTSDAKIKPLLSASQLQKLQNLRKEQQQDLRRLIVEQKSVRPS
jgi:hypothetical protein